MTTETKIFLFSNGKTGNELRQYIIARLQEVFDLNIQDKISEFSHIHIDTVFLNTTEDIDTYVKATGIKEIETVYHQQDMFDMIRDYAHYDLKNIDTKLMINTDVHDIVEFNELSKRRMASMISNNFDNE